MGLEPEHVIHELPAWKVELYLAGIEADLAPLDDAPARGDEPPAEDPADDPDPFATPPPSLRT